MTKKAPHILVVEDDEWLADHYVAILKQHDYQAAAVHNALEAMDVIDVRMPQVIVLDVLLTGTTAFSLLNELQSYDDTGEVPVIVVSNLGADLPKGSLKHYGVHAYLDKTTMQPEDLVYAVKRVLA